VAPSPAGAGHDLESRCRADEAGAAVPGRECWFGIDCLWHARLRGALPPVMVRGEDAQDLTYQVVRWERLNGQAD
jgi:hypothetical protein